MDDLSRIGKNAFDNCPNLSIVCHYGSDTYNQLAAAGLADFAAAEPGSCGDDVVWVLEDGVLTITGSGAIADCQKGEAP